MADGDIGLIFTDIDPDVFDTVVPTFAEVAAINRARAEDSRGIGQQTFNDDTIPTGDEVDLLVHLAAKWVFDTLGPNVPSDFLDRARATAAFKAAEFVEGGAHEPREGLMKLWADTAQAGLDSIAKRMEEIGAGGEEGPSDDAQGVLYSFPCAEPLPESA